VTVRIARAPSKCTRRFAPGDARRVPKDLTILSGYYVGCPGCGRAVSISITAATIVEEGMDVGETPAVSISPVTCDRCGVHFRVDRDEVVTLGS
jgi:ferredoxin